MRLAVAHSPGTINNFGGLLDDISVVAHRASGNQINNSCDKIDNFGANYTIPVFQLQYVTVFGKSYMLMSNIILYYYLYHTVSV